MFDAAPHRPRKTPLKSFRSLGQLGTSRSRGEISGPRRHRLIRAWFKACGRDCGECGVEMVLTPPPSGVSQPRQASIDHIIARCLGGTNALSNLRVICRACNNAKSVAEAAALVERKRMYRRRAQKAAQTRARNKARASQVRTPRNPQKAARKAFYRALARGATPDQARAIAADVRAAA